MLGEYIYIHVSLSFEKPFWNCICVSFDGICRKEANGKAKVEASKGEKQKRPNSDQVKFKCKRTALPFKMAGNVHH